MTSRGSTSARDALRACLLAGAVGDALGGSIEFDRIDRIRGRFGPSGLTDYAPAYGRLGAITDDTQMTLFTLEGLVLARRRGSDPVHEVRVAYGRWLRTQGGPEVAADGWLLDVPELHQTRAPGNTCLTALRSGLLGTVEAPINDSKGCGAVMRAAPVALWSERPDEVFALAAATGALTHGHPSGYLSAGVLAVLVQQLWQGAELTGAIDVARDELQRWEGHEEQLVLLDLAAEMGTRGVRPTPEVIETALGGGWVGEEALAIAVLTALAAETLADGLLLAVNHSGDSDSTGALCGNLLGARDGAGALPAHWLESLELADVIGRLADEAGEVFGR
ncbi:ADP-ribosylglycohydrolase family protein [Actinosynnema sp. NPDC047251]|uniref:ADP-ribosylation/Crystallin J1 n=1 Tax=Saccharothrix espanaensis (strain ATCC 51144 / DSM 44229 / JCM 9112 / NBRC 15066 / NRRL 15764) TaxID=1179773 RepID=K0KAD8_SACES|nr:ADP-ribosylglycohydrolase family protein [Saccharothrix espanaensis]CCH35276.1 ADP-ribosylation/Crystallin J1 [Saccharothrix espanaensis DSM 44229]